jgi:2-hydroxy-6-oxonona-2,4-dienedioate hydrolase
MSTTLPGWVDPVRTDEGAEYIEINGCRVVYEFLGPESGEPIALTPGGRFSKDVPGLRPLAEKLADGGMRVLLWDRPNTGASDVQFSGVTESHMRADTLAELVKQLGIAPCVIAGGSGGARDSILTVILHPEVATKLIAWSIVGGVYSTMSLAGVYVLPNIQVCKSAGIEAVIEMPEWKARIEANPRNRDRLLELGTEGFFKAMMRWLYAFVPKPGQTIPGVVDDEFEKITVPTMIIRGGFNDIDHPRRTSLEVHSLIPQSKLVEPPWPEDAWERAVESAIQGRGHIFDPWPKAAPTILDFVESG